MRGAQVFRNLLLPESHDEQISQSGQRNSFQPISGRLLIADWWKVEEVAKLEAVLESNSVPLFVPLFLFSLFVSLFDILLVSFFVTFFFDLFVVIFLLFCLLVCFLVI